MTPSVGLSINNHNSTINNQQFLDALALAADEHAGHAVRCVARDCKCCIGAVPAGVVGVVSGGTALAVAAMAAGSAVQNDLVWAGGPVFVDVELGGLGCRACGF